MVARRLEKNARLKSRLVTEHREELTLRNGIFVPAMTLPFDGDRVGGLFKFITQGLLYHHFGVTLDRHGESGAPRTPFPAQGGQQSGDCGQRVMAA